MNNLIRVAFRCNNIVNFTECKRFAGHSKWSNIRHIKAEKDGQKQAAMMQLTRQMKVAIAEGKSAKPEENSKLAKLIEQAKKRSLPMTTVKSFLEKMQSSKNRVNSVVFESRGPSGSIFLIHVLCENVNATKNQLNTHLRKTKFSPSDIAQQTPFQEKGVIITEVGNLSFDKALEDAIEVGAEEAEKGNYEDKEFFQFTCSSNDIFKVRNQLEDRNYNVISSDVEYIPIVTVSLDEEQQKLVDKLYERLDTMEEVVKIYNNIV
ncbi:translational activator of cytochrome c oxidase 1 [Copidosoma floridanum]|uniref:translational activator of cytochrome c oxidase 1 n=1 Tax=Copidosoma floridanum TaxID=29053 RepID=UPI0006C9B86D|nr:translational activator of cytochrome c oxidase 1 [Copidosoma floridanum]